MIEGAVLQGCKLFVRLGGFRIGLRRLRAANPDYVAGFDCVGAESHGVIIPKNDRSLAFAGPTEAVPADHAIVRLFQGPFNRGCVIIVRWRKNYDLHGIVSE
jgi:hypothetical protein